MMKYSSVKAATFNESQNVENQRSLKMLKAAPTRWLSHGETSKRAIAKLGPLVNALETLYNEKRHTEIKSFQDPFLNPDAILMLLLLADTLHHANRFPVSLQTKNLVCSDISAKFLQLCTEIENLKTEGSPLFLKHEEEFLNLFHEQMKDARRLPEANLLEDGYDATEKVSLSKQTIKTKFLKQLENEVKEPMFVNDAFFAGFDIFNLNASFDENKTVEKVSIFAKFYGNGQIPKKKLAPNKC